MLAEMGLTMRNVTRVYVPVMAAGAPTRTATQRCLCC
jgi:hypothetical protein